MKKFDYKQYLAEGWMFQEAGAKDNYFTRQRRAQQGNWEGSVGKYVEDHKAEIDDVARNGNLRAYIVSTMKPALSPEGQEYVEKLLTGYASNKQLYIALYNILLKGQGLGLHEEAGSSRVKQLISILTREVQNSQSENGILDLRPAGMDLTYTSEDGFEVGAYILSQGEDGEIYVSTGPEDNPMSEDDIALTELPNFLQESGASLHEVEILLDAMVEAVKSLGEDY